MGPSYFQREGKAMNNIIILVIGMGLVTYLPRMIPMAILQEIRLPAFIKRFLEFVPYAVLGALIFPGIIYSTKTIGSAIFGTILALIVAFFEVNIIFVVFSGIFGVYLWSLFF